MKIELDDNIVHPKRLVIMTLLFVFKEMRESDLQRATGFSWGMLSTHLKKLEESGYIKRVKKLTRNGTATIVKITDKGYAQYLKEKEKLENLFDKQKV
jgi:DNA-binding MarR family transcriptional regulator